MANKRWGEILREIREAKGLRQPYIAQKLNCSVANISDMENGKVNIDESKLLEWLRALEVSPLEFFQHQQSPIPFKPFQTIPVLNSVKCSFDGLWEASDRGFPPGASDEYVPAPMTGDPNAFALKISGKSMVDCGYEEGDFLVLTPNIKHESGQNALVLIGPERLATVKQVFYKDTSVVRLASRDSAWEEKIYDMKKVEIRIYPVRWHIRDEKKKKRRKPK